VKQILEIRTGYSSLPNGDPLALVIYTNRTCEQVAHDEFGRTFRLPDRLR
jgi:hypothetical protein